MIIITYVQCKYICTSVKKSDFNFPLTRATIPIYTRKKDDKKSTKLRVSIYTNGKRVYICVCEKLSVGKAETRPLLKLVVVGGVGAETIKPASFRSTISVFQLLYSCSVIASSGASQIIYINIVNLCG